ncbi:MAG: cytochrome c oxidase subunit II [bacterium]|nr:cytochrome c oxidase subunit II [bacterium]
MGSGKLAAWFPPDASFHASEMDSAFFTIYMAAAFAVILVVGLAFLFVMQNRRKDKNEKALPTGKANMLFQGLWVLCALGLALFAFNLDFCGFMDRQVAPGNATQIEVTARQWDYDFVYPNGHVADTLHVSIGEAVQLNLTSEDVVHSLTIPALRLNQAALPGQKTSAWFRADRQGTYDVRSNIYSGKGYPGMQTALVTHTEAGFDKWMASVTDIFAGKTMEEVGELLYNKHGCKACHSIDGVKLVGPSFKDLYGHTFDTKEGIQVVADDAYIKESILTPNVSVIAGFEPVMTPYEGKLNDKEIEAITAWLKTMSSLGADGSSQQEGN